MRMVAYSQRIFCGFVVLAIERKNDLQGDQDYFCVSAVSDDSGSMNLEG